LRIESQLRLEAQQRGLLLQGSFEKFTSSAQGRQVSSVNTFSDAVKIIGKNKSALDSLVRCILG
jgi:hypothetical protein